MLGYYQSKDHPREYTSKALKLDLEAVRPHPSIPLEEYRYACHLFLFLFWGHSLAAIYLFSFMFWAMGFKKLHLNFGKKKKRAYVK